MEVYYSITIHSIDEILMALISQYDFDSIEENDDHFIVYIKASAFDNEIRKEIEALIQSKNVHYTIEEIQPQNWNALWEASFQPVIVGSFCQVRADFHPAVDGIQYDLIINPKMAFGTGHHATTYMMIKHMSEIDFNAKSVLDFGCGTGILAILASKMGAIHIDAIDIEHESYLNTIENAEINHVENVKSIEGELGAATNNNYDVILANINRNILTSNAATLVSLMNPGGYLLLSGILEDDASIVLQSFIANGVKEISQSSKDGWVCISLTRC